MRKNLATLFISILLCITTISFASNTKDIFPLLKQLPNISVNKIEGDTTFSQYYEIWFTQPIDHKHPELGNFKQRVLLGHRNLTQPMVVELQGYNIWTEKAGELSKLLDANQLTIEHRFFKDSRPDSIPWNKLNIYQAAADQHHIIKTLKKIYKTKWISTGISKGGQTTIYHRFFYPDDVDVSIPYVAPLNLAREDSRIHHHLSKVGKRSCRKRIYDYQIRLFENRDKILPLLKKHTQDKNYHFSIGLKKALDLNILEYPFAFWQWGNTSIDQIPGKYATPKELFDHLIKTSSFSFFEDSSIEQMRPFFYQALTQMGMYSYKIAPFKKYLTETRDLTFDFTLPKGIKGPFDKSPMQKVNQWLQSDAKNMLFIYGEYDAWSATAVNLKGNHKCKKFVNPKGAHGTRINSFPVKMQKEIIKTIKGWLNTETHQEIIN